MKFFKLVFGALFTFSVARKETLGDAPVESASTKEATSVHDFSFYNTVIIQRLNILLHEWWNKILLQFFSKPLARESQKRTLEPLSINNI
ncbi:hypothetical protein J0X14_00290 [Muricauda sp. CAU 1633]|uniref:hypothetical protein n=1 Tax=Allomuricauda sp. CAU 1633 TaxID=2816036 RepID=UPI001A8DC109|nr:hypothetical protein [Muricauda sp. CAU 1633]MBO0320716.1 hypothetical protein [Muricauda sp. CAU 1633]